MEYKKGNSCFEDYLEIEDKDGSVHSVNVNQFLLGVREFPCKNGNALLIEGDQEKEVLKLALTTLTKDLSEDIGTSYVKADVLLCANLPCGGTVSVMISDDKVVVSLNDIDGDQLEVEVADLAVSDGAEEAIFTIVDTIDTHF